MTSKNNSLESGKIFIIIPAYNEEKKILSVINEVKKHFDNIVIVNDNSSDKTRQVAESSGVVVINHPLNRGQGAALETGDRYALNQNADIIVHFDADGQFLAREIKNLVSPIQKAEADIVMGSRFLDKKTKMPALKKYFIMPIARKLLFFLYGARLSDPQNGFRAFNRLVASKLRIDNDGAAHCTEIIVKTLKNKWTFLEVPVTVIYNDFGQGIFSGKGRGSGGIKILKSLFLQKLIK